MITDMSVMKKRAAPFLKAGELLLKQPKYQRAIMAARRAQIAWVGGGDELYIASILAAAMPHLKEIVDDDRTRPAPNLHLVPNSFDGLSDY